MRSDAEIAMKNMGLNFDIENSIVLKTISSEYISMLFDHDEPSLQEVKMAFLVFDENNDGYIDASDLRRVLHNIGLGEQAGIGECEQMIARYDMNKDMRIDMMEFTKVLEASFCWTYAFLYSFSYINELCLLTCCDGLNCIILLDNKMVDVSQIRFHAIHFHAGHILILEEHNKEQ